MYMKLLISVSVKEKLKEKHGVNISEVEECFLNRCKGFLEDTREKNKTNPPTQWFIAETDHGRNLKVVFVRYPNGSVALKTAYEPNKTEVAIYDRNA